MAGGGNSDGAGGRSLTDTPLGKAVQRTIAENALMLGARPSVGPGAQGYQPPAPGSARDIAGKIWNAPNTVLGTIYGGIGAAVGGANYLLHGQKAPPKAFLRDNALQFTNNPFGGVSAITIGNTTTWKDDPYDPNDREWHWPDGSPKLEKGHLVTEHETAHTYQGQQLGPAYLGSNLAGGLNALFHGQDWHGDHNWNERGPMSPNARPWAPMAAK